MTAQQYLLDQAAQCRRNAGRQVDRFFADALLRLAEEFEREAAGQPLPERRSARAA